MSGVDANTEADCRIVGVVNSVQNYWNAEFERSGLRYEPAQTVFDGEVNTACGVASSPWARSTAPATAWSTSTSASSRSCRRASAPRAAPSPRPVIAHEYGHHVQNLLGVLDQIGGDREGPESLAVRSEPRRIATRASGRAQRGGCEASHRGAGV